MKKFKSFILALVLGTILITGYSVKAETFEYIAGSKLDLPHNGNVYGSYRKFNYNTPYNVYIWDIVEDVPRTPGTAKLTVHLQKKKVFSNVDVKVKSIKVETNATNSIIEFKNVGSGTYRYWHSTNNGSGNDGDGRFKSNNVGIYSKQL